MTPSDPKPLLTELKRLAHELRNLPASGTSRFLPCGCKVELGALDRGEDEPEFTAVPCDRHASQVIAELLCLPLGLN